MAVAWDLEALTKKWQAKWWEAGLHHADRREDAARSAGSSRPKGVAAAAGPLPNAARSAVASRPTFFIHFAYPGISGYLHVGHMRGFTYADVLARFKRQTGHDVLFPAGFHASGIPAVAFAKEVERGEKDEYLRQNGYTGDIQDLADPRKVVDYFAHVYTHDYWKPFGFLIDDRRDCTTIDEGYQRFIQWQFRRLKDKGWLIQKPHYAPFCPVAGPVAVDKSETDIKQGGGAEILEFVTLRFRLPAGTLRAEELVLPCATLRPETVFGVTNVWVHPGTEYHVVRVWDDGATADDDPSELWLVSAQGARKLEWQFERAEPTHDRVRADELVGQQVTVPLAGRAVPVVAGDFVDPKIATGIVMSVPAHAPFDFAAYRDAGLLEDLGEPPQIIDVEGYDDLPARVACDRHGVETQGEKGPLEEATQQVYSDEFNKGVLNDACGPYAGERVKAVKDRIRTDVVEGGHGRMLRQFSEPVISRAGEVVEIRRIPDQDFIHYADPDWTALAKRHAATMDIHPARYKEDLPNVLDWFGDRACVRRGSWLGTEFPFKPGWIIEPIADSTFYPWYYLVSLYVNDGRLRADELEDALFDYVYNGKGEAKAPVWEEVRRDVLHWGPVDVNLGGKEHQTVHFPVYVMNMCGLMEEGSLWPRGIFVNWWVTQKAGAKISKSKGGAEPIPGAAHRYGVDPMRLYYCHVGSPHVDIEWDPDLVLSYRQRVERICRIVDDVLAVEGAPGAMDAWLEAAFGRAVGRAMDAYDASDLRTAATELAYTVPDEIRWYQRRGGGHGPLLRRVVRDWAIALCPISPHVAEEAYARAGGEGLCSDAAMPDPGPPDEAALAAEEHVQAVLEDIQTILRLSGERPGMLRLYTAPAWKRELAAAALSMAARSDGRFPVGAFMAKVMEDPANRRRGKEVQTFCGRLPAWVNQLTPGQRALVGGGADEAAILRAAAPFLAAEADVQHVEVVADDDGAPEHPKRAAAAPLKPGIALIPAPEVKGQTPTQ